MKKNINGIFILDKPIGMSSNHALQKVKRLFSAKKAGHTGSLDPLATGLLPICFGEATKFSQFLLDADKTYSVTMRLGVRTTTSDAEGEVVAEKPVPTALTLEKINRLFDHFRGQTQQIPSMFSALKHNGRPLYELARQGITVDRPSRPITIFDLSVLSFQDNQVDFTVHCSKGTYVRTLVDDFGELLGCGAHVARLHRVSAGPFKASQMMSIEQLESDIPSNDYEKYLLPIDCIFHGWEKIAVSPAFEEKLLQGQSVISEKSLTPGFVALFSESNSFFGVAEALEDGRVIPRRMMSR